MIIIPFLVFVLFTLLSGWAVIERSGDEKGWWIAACGVCALISAFMGASVMNANWPGVS